MNNLKFNSENFHQDKRLGEIFPKRLILLPDGLPSELGHYGRLRAE